MNVLQIKIHEDGTLECSPDFKIIRGGYRNILMNVEVPHTLLLDPVKGEESNQNVTGNFVRVAAVIRTVVGKNIQTEKYSFEPIKDFESNGKMYRVYQRIMPKEFTMWETVNQSERFGSGKLQLIFNVVNWSMEDSENAYSQNTKIERVVSSPVLALDVFSGGYIEDTDAIDNPKDYEILKGRVDNVENGLNNANSDIKALQDKDTEIDAFIGDLINEVNEKPYFYGWYNSYDDLIANFPSATENDYAYIIGGNIYEYHNNQWLDTGNKTPDNIAPLSDDDPMPVGDIASPGTSSKVAKGDHVHKENEKTRADIDKNTADIASHALAIDNKLDKSQLVQETGQSTTEIMSQKAVTDNLNSEIDNRKYADLALQTQIDNEITNRTNADNVLQSLINQKLDVSKIKKGNSTFKFVAGNGTKLVHTWNAPATGYLIFYFGTWYGSERITQVGIAQGIRPVVGTETMVSIEAAPIGVTFFGRVNAGDAINVYTTSNSSWGGENTGYLRYLLLED